MDRYDIIAIGGGAGGLVTAAGAAGLGARVALIERHRMGGECLWTGCVPSKALLAAARVVANARAAGHYGVELGEPRVNFARVMQHVHSAQEVIAPNDSPERFRSLGVNVVAGTATFIDRSCITVNGATLRARHIVIATGSRPALPDIPGLPAVPYFTNENIFTIDVMPASLIVLGGGAVGIELAHAFALLGSKVTVLENDAQILRTEDRELVELLSARLRADGVIMHTGVTVKSAARETAGVRLTTSQGDFAAAALLIAAGRQPNTDTLKLEAAGVASDAKGLQVDRFLRTTAPNVWGVGDVTAGAPRFTHVADYHARLVLRNALFPGRSAVDYSTVPWAIYTHPELAHIGLTEAEARERHGDSVQVWRKQFNELDRAIADGQTEGLVKIVADARGTILGAHILGQQASSMLGEVTLAMKSNISLARLAAVMHAYPTYPEAIKHIADARVRANFGGLAQRAARWLVRR
jgi:pyruvate/2-oxoglutarate dehydrogenase complex dihydrolipoamide dehydrogenase (E3) component